MRFSSKPIEPPPYPQNEFADPSAVRNREAEGRLLRLARLVAARQYVKAEEQASEDLDWIRRSST